MIYHDGKQELLAHNPLEVQCKDIKTLIQRISAQNKVLKEQLEIIETPKQTNFKQ